MPRSCKSAKTLSDCSQTKEEIEIRIEQEEKLKGKADKLEPLKHLNKNQIEIFNYIKNELEESKLLGNLDIWILSRTAIAIDRLNILDAKVNESPLLMLNKKINSAIDKYEKLFNKGVAELSLSPQSRAKIGNINLQANEDNNGELAKALREDEEEEEEYYSHEDI